MSEREQDGNARELAQLRAEIVRLNKVVEALMDRAEESSKVEDSDYNAFRTTILLEEQVKRRTEEMKVVLREKDAALQALWASEAKFRGIVNQPMAGISIIEQGKLVFANPKFAEIFGYSVDEVMALPPYAIIAERDRNLVREQLLKRFNSIDEQVDYIFRGLRKDGTEIDVECHGSVAENNGNKVLFSMLLDVTDRVRTERAIHELQEQLQQMAFHDPLTGLYNRAPLNEFFDREINLAVRRQNSLSVVMGDIDHFKQVNDTYGHLAGDETLKHIAELIRSVFRASDIFCRYGGEEFLILLPDTSLEVAKERAEWLRETVSDSPSRFGDILIPLTISLGVAVYPRDGASRAELIAAADRAMYCAKNNGRNQVRTA